MDSAPNLFADTIAPVRRASSDEVFFICVEACPEPGAPDFGEFGGAFVNCYVDASDLRAAELAMIEMLQAEGWRPYRFDGWELTSLAIADADVPDDGSSSQRALVQKALTDGSACEFFCWEMNPPSPDEH